MVPLLRCLKHEKTLLPERWPLEKSTKGHPLARGVMFCLIETCDPIHELEREECFVVWFFRFGAGKLSSARVLRPTEVERAATSSSAPAVSISKIPFDGRGEINLLL